MCRSRNDNHFLPAFFNETETVAAVKFKFNLKRVTLLR